MPLSETDFKSNTEVFQMARTIILIVSAIAIVLTATMVLPGLTINAVLASNEEVDAATTRQALASTVQILLMAPILDAQGQPVIITNGTDRQMQYQSGEGLGTLARMNNELVIITHDHWTLLNSQLAKARFYDANNTLLAEVNGADFLAMIRSRDGGTMVLAAPAELLNNRGLTVAQIGSKQTASWGDAVAVVYRNPDTWNLEVRTMVVRETADYHNHPSYILQSSDDTIVVPGNSGGGIWHNGALVGNMWTTMVADNLEDGSAEALSMSRGAVLSTDNPVSGELTQAPTVAAETVVNGGFQREIQP
jgi:hypothetical protein